MPAITTASVFQLLMRGGMDAHASDHDGVSLSTPMRCGTGEQANSCLFLLSYCSGYLVHSDVAFLIVDEHTDGPTALPGLCTSEG